LAKEISDFYPRPASMTFAGEFMDMLKELPNDIGSLVRIVQGLGVYDVVAPEFYGFNIPDERKNEIHIRSIRRMLSTHSQARKIPTKKMRSRKPISSSLLLVLFASSWFHMFVDNNVPARR
jgi:hypothetical protein